MTGAVKFNPHEIPESLRTYVTALENEHHYSPFSFRDSRTTALRVGELASKMKLEANVYRGHVSYLGCEVDRLWCAIKTDEIDSDLVIDPSLPLNDEEFTPLFRSYAAADADELEIERFVENTGFHSRVLGKFPQTVSFIGRLRLLDRARYS